MAPRVLAEGEQAGGDLWCGCTNPLQPGVCSQTGCVVMSPMVEKLRFLPAKDANTTGDGLQIQTLVTKCEEKWGGGGMPCNNT